MLVLWVVRYKTGIGPKNHELALVYPSSDLLEVHYLFGDRAYVSSVEQLHKTCICVDKNMLDKVMYKFVFDRDIEAVKAAAFRILPSQVHSLPNHLYLMSSVLT